MQSYDERLEENICFRATPTERIALERLALREDRTPSGLLRRLLRQAAREAGLLEQPACEEEAVAGSGRVP